MSMRSRVSRSRLGLMKQEGVQSLAPWFTVSPSGQSLPPTKWRDYTSLLTRNSSLRRREIVFLRRSKGWTKRNLDTWLMHLPRRRSQTTWWLKHILVAETWTDSHMTPPLASCLKYSRWASKCRGSSAIRWVHPMFTKESFVNTVKVTLTMRPRSFANQRLMTPILLSQLQVSAPKSPETSCCAIGPF